jgi:hypothetical protein
METWNEKLPKIILKKFYDHFVKFIMWNDEKNDIIYIAYIMLDNSKIRIGGIAGITKL